MATREHRNAAIFSGSAAEHVPTAELVNALGTLRRVAKIAAKHNFKLTTHNYYASKARECVTEVRRVFLALRSAYPKDQDPSVAAQFDEVEKLLARVENGLLLPPHDLVASIESVSHLVRADLSVAIRATANHQRANERFITPEILPAGVYRKVLDEVNRCFAQDCPNACAAMLRRLVESLIIEAFESHGIELKIKDGMGEYFELKALIGKAIAEPTLKLSPNTRSALPNLKFLGDLSVHARRNLVRSDDLKYVHNDARYAIEELASHLPRG